MSKHQMDILVQSMRLNDVIIINGDIIPLQSDKHGNRYFQYGNTFGFRNGSDVVVGDSEDCFLLHDNKLVEAI